jgi:ribonuclease E
LDIAVGGAAKLVGKKVKIRVERVLDGTAFATLAGAGKQAAAPITAEGLAEKPTRVSRSRKVAEEAVDDVVEAVAEEAVDEPAADAVEEPAEAPKKKRTRRGSRGGRNRKKKPAAAAAAAASSTNGEVAEPAASPKIHMPASDLGAESSTDGDERTATGDDAQGDAEAPKKKRTRRGSRGGRRRRKPAGAGVSGEAAESATPAVPAPE